MTVFFDLDDTLIDCAKGQDTYIPALYEANRERIRHSLPVFRKKWTGCINRHFREYSLGRISFREQRARRIRESFGNYRLTEAELDIAIHSFEKCFRDSWELFPDAISAVSGLREKGYRTGMVTNGSAGLQNEKIDRLGLRGYFDAIIISEECGCSKPSREIFERACASLSANPAASWFVGDNFENDVLGSKGAGMRPLWLNTRREIRLFHGISAFTSLTEACGHIIKTDSAPTGDTRSKK